MGPLLLALAGTIVLSGSMEIPGRLIDVVDAGTLQVSTARGNVELRVLGMECPRIPRRKCAGKSKAACESSRRFAVAAQTRARLLLSRYELRLIPCGKEFEADGHGRTFGAVQVSEDKDYLSKMVDEGWCTRLPLACARPE